MDADDLIIVSKSDFSDYGVPKTLKPFSRNAPLLASYAQQRLWNFDRLEAVSKGSNLPLSFRFKGQFDAKVWQRALQEIVNRHEVLRTVIEEADGEVYQRIRADVEVEVKEKDLRALGDTEKMRAVQELGDEEAKRLFDLQNDVLLRGYVCQLDDEEFELLLTLHYIAADACSVGLLFNEISLLYKAYSEGLTSPLPPLRIQYVDFAQWQRNWLQGQEQERQLAYWKGQLEALPALHSLPLDYARPPQQQFKGKTFGQTVDVSLVERIHQYCQRKQVTLFIFLQSAFSVLLSRYSHETDIVIGSPMTGRVHNDLEPLIGLFANTLVLRSDVSGNPGFGELLERNRRTIFQAHEHQSIPFEALVEELQPERNLSHSPLFQVMLTLHNDERPSLRLEGLEEVSEADNDIVDGFKYDIELTAFEHSDQLYLEWTYNCDLFASETIERMLSNFLVLLEGIMDNPEATIGELPMLTGQELHLLQKEWNDTESIDQDDRTVVSLFESQVAAAPDAIAVSDGTSSLSYRDLNESSNRLGHYLKDAGVCRDTLVGLCVDRSVSMVVGMLGIMKAGGAYVPLDPEYPSERLTYMLEDAGAELVVTRKGLASLVPPSVQPVYLDDEDVLNIFPLHNLAEAGIEPDQLAYVIYTSGSTGKPKGVCIEHRSLTNFQASMAFTPGFKSIDRILTVASICSDQTVLDIFLTLTQGGHLFVAGSEDTYDGGALGRLISQNDITFMHATPTTWRILLESGWIGKQDLVAVIGGEAWPLALNQAIQPLVKKVWNAYGPTETTVYSTLENVKADADQVCVGKGIANTQLYILDEYKNLAPSGGIGELYIGGHGLARGYWNKPDLTAERFVSNPFDESTRLYRTGDLVRWRADGRLEFVGRKDNQVKIRGFRIEIGEIESQLVKIPGVFNACVVVLELPDSGEKSGRYISKEKGLVAFIQVDDESLNLINIRKASNKLLPKHMIPAYFKIMDKFPLTPNTKIDRKKLQPIFDAEK